MESGDPICTGTGLRLYWEGARGSTLYWDMGQSLLDTTRRSTFYWDWAMTIHGMEPGNPVCTGTGLTLDWEVARGSKKYQDRAQSILGGGQGIHFAQGQGPVCTGRGPKRTPASAEPQCWWCCEGAAKGR